MKRNLKIGRNDKCHCGSGKNYKKCCMNKDLIQRSETLKVNISFLHDYIKYRVEVEKNEWELEGGFFEHFFTVGIRSFFGVTVNDECQILFDEQQPNDGFYEDFVFQYYVQNIGLSKYLELGRCNS